MARPVDPTRARRGTGNRPKPGEAVVHLLPDLTAAGPPPVPEDLELSPYAAGIWTVAVAELHHRGLKEPDLEAIRMMCIQAQRARQAGDLISLHGLMVENARGGLTENPMLRVERDATREYIRIAQDFGLTFAARLRLGLLQLTGESILSTLNSDLDRAAIAPGPARARRAPAKKATKKPAKKK